MFIGYLFVTLRTEHYSKIIMAEESNIDNIACNMLRWAREVGSVQLGYFRGDHLGISSKLDESDIVTDADKASERVLIDHIRREYPHHAILSEESGEADGDSGYRWVIDPLDGTTNFSEGLPDFCVSIGLQYRDETMAGVVFAPYLGEMFHAVKGQGAYLNGKPIAVSGKQDIAKAVVNTGFPYDKHINPDNNLDNVSGIFTHLRALRILGSAAMDLCYCAAGFLDGYWEVNLHEWDVCAGTLILQEAGGEATRFRSDRNISLVAGTPAIHRWLLEHLKP